MERGGAPKWIAWRPRAGLLRAFAAGMGLRLRGHGLRNETLHGATPAARERDGARSETRRPKRGGGAARPAVRKGAAVQRDPPAWRWAGGRGDDHQAEVM